MPIVGILLGGINFSHMGVHLGDAFIGYGIFIQSLVDFAIVAFVIFLVVKGLSHLKSEKEAPAATATPEDVLILREIRDTLRTR